MRWVKCGRDGRECDLNTKTKTCRHMNGTWPGQCFDRYESCNNTSRIRKIHDPNKDDAEEEER